MSKKINYNYSISETGLLVRENKDIFEVFIDGEWVMPETNVGYLMPASASEVHGLIRKVLSGHYHSQEEYKDKTLPGC